jgi:hypothetical protein
MASKGALSASDFIRLKRRKVNNDYYNSDKLNRIPAYERENVISRKPLPTTATENYIIQQLFGGRSSQQSGIGTDLSGGNSGPVVYVFDFYGGDSGPVAYVADLYGGSATVFIS